MNSSHSVNNDKLRLAVEEEKLAAAASLKRYKLLSSKITQYQMGEGPAPSEEEFSQWLADVQRAVELKRVLAGITVT